MKAALALCNACGERAPTSEEHFISAPIGRVIVGDMTIAAEPEVRARLRELLEGYVREEPQEAETATSVARLASRRIRNLVCAKCNAEKFGPLEVQAADLLASFLLRDGPANAFVLRRWAWLFALKAYWSTTDSKALREGDLHLIFESILNPRTRVQTSVRLVRLAPPGSDWPFAVFIDRRGPMFSHVIFVMRGTAWLVSPWPEDRPNPYPFPTVELVHSIRLREHVPRVSLGQLGLLESVSAHLAHDAVR